MNNKPASGTKEWAQSKIIKKNQGGIDYADR
jgi:hypothetical protein